MSIHQPKGQSLGSDKENLSFNASLKLKLSADYFLLSQIIIDIKVWKPKKFYNLLKYTIFDIKIIEQLNADKE